MSTAWSQDDDRRVVDMRNVGASDVAIAAAIGRSRKSVQTRLVRLRARGAVLQSFMRQPWSEDRIQLVIAAIADGRTFAAIARDLGITGENVRINVRLLRAEGRVPDPDDQDEVILVPVGDPLLAALRAEHGGRSA